MALAGRGASATSAAAQPSSAPRTGPVGGRGGITAYTSAISAPARPSDQASPPVSLSRVWTPPPNTEATSSFRR